MLVIFSLVLAFLGLFYGGVMSGAMGNHVVAWIMIAGAMYVILVACDLIIGVENCKAAFQLRRPIAWRKKSPADQEALDAFTI